MPGVSIHTRQHQGRHKALRHGGRGVIGPWAAAWPAGLAIAVIVAVLLLAAVAAQAAGRAVVWVWRKLRSGGRLVAVMVLIWPSCHLLVRASLVSHAGAWALALTVTAVCAATLVLRQIQAQHRKAAEVAAWPEKARAGGAVLDGGWERYAARQLAGFRRLETLEVGRREIWERLQENSERVDGLDAKVSEVLMLMAAAAAEMGIAPNAAGCEDRHLRLVSESPRSGRGA